MTCLVLSNQFHVETLAPLLILFAIQLQTLLGFDNPSLSVARLNCSVYAILQRSL